MQNNNDRQHVAAGRGGSVSFQRAAGSALLLAMLIASGASGATNDAAPGWLTQPLSMVQAIRIALAQNADITKSLHDIEAAHGVAIQTRALVLPKLRGTSGYEHTEAVEKDPLNLNSGFRPQKDQWSGSIRVVQSIYEGGRMLSALRSARLIQAQSYREYQTVLASTLLEVRTAYYDVLLTGQQILVQDASVKLLEAELENTKRRFEEGVVPRFNVLRSEVKVANAQPQLIRAQNAHRIAKNALATLLGYNLPANVWEDIPFTLTTGLEVEPFDIALPGALTQARANRPELAALQIEVELQKEKIIAAKSGYKPNLNVFAGYGANNSQFSERFREDVSGPMAGVALSWAIWDGRATEGKVTEAKATEAKAGVNLEDRTRRIEQEVRTAYSSFLEARQIIESQKKVVERADEAIRLAASRYDAGAGTQLDVLDAQTSLTEARTTQIQAARNFLVARARLERAIGVDVAQEQPAKKP